MTGAVIGLVDIETSHPNSWIPILKDLGFEVALYDSGRRFAPAQIRAFADEHGVKQVYDDLDEMSRTVDLGIVCTANWDLHLAQSLPFIAEGKPVLVDKPLAGSWSDLDTMRLWEEQGYVVGGGSSLRYSSEIFEVRDRLAHQGNEILSVYAGCSGFDYYYAVHLVSMLQGLLGPGITSARQLGTDPWRVELAWVSGQTAIIEVAPPDHSVPFGMSIMTDKGWEQRVITDIQRLYRDFLETVVPGLLQGVSPVPVKELLEVELALMAGLTSMERGGSWVRLSELGPKSPVYDGSAFFNQYMER